MSIPASPAQTLARPGWASSGLTITKWWHNAVIVEVTPGATAASGKGTLQTLRGQLDDLQTLGADAILLRSLTQDPASVPGESSHANAGPPLSPIYGTLEDLDALLQDCSQRRERVLVEISASLSAETAASLSRFWLSRGVSGLYVSSAASSDANSVLQAIRASMRGYAGQRLLVSDADLTGSDRKAGSPDLVFSTLRGLGGSAPADLAALRSSLESMRRERGTESVAVVDPKAPPVRDEAAKARVAVLAAATGGFALRLNEIGLGPEAQAQAAQARQDAADAQALSSATSPAAVGNIKRAIARRKAAPALRYDGDATFQWTARMVGLHRGNGAMLEGEQTLVNQDAAGTLVSIWRGRNGATLTELVNLSPAATSISLAEPFRTLRLHGSFLRPMARSDGGMGALALDGAKLPPFGVFFGQLGR